MSGKQEVLLRVDHLCQYFGDNRAVDDVSFEIYRGEVFGLVGESGCGKTTTGRCIIGLYPITSGKIFFDGRPIVPGRPGSEKGIQMIFQDPMASLDPRMIVREIIGEEKELHVQVTETEYKKILEEAEAIVNYLGKNTFIKIYH